LDVKLVAPLVLSFLAKTKDPTNAMFTLVELEWGVDFFFVTCLTVKPTGVAGQLAPLVVDVMLIQTANLWGDVGHNLKPLALSIIGLVVQLVVHRVVILKKRLIPPLLQLLEIAIRIRTSIRDIEFDRRLVPL
jgi:hypothetical protein